VVCIIKRARLAGNGLERASEAEGRRIKGSRRIRRERESRWKTDGIVIRLEMVKTDRREIHARVNECDTGMWSVYETGIQRPP